MQSFKICNWVGILVQVLFLKIVFLINVNEMQIILVSLSPKYSKIFKVHGSHFFTMTEFHDFSMIFPGFFC